MGMLTRTNDRVMDMNDLMRTFFEGVPEEMSDSWTRWVPERKMSVRVHEHDVQVVMPCAGCARSDFEIETSRDFVTVKVAKRNEPQLTGDDKRFTIQERSFAAYQESVRLPVDVRSGEAKAKYADGVLTITVPRLEEKKNAVKQIVVE